MDKWSGTNEEMFQYCILLEYLKKDQDKNELVFNNESFNNQY